MSGFMRACALVHFFSWARLNPKLSIVLFLDFLLSLSLSLDLLLLLLFVFIAVNYFNLFNNCGNPSISCFTSRFIHFDGKSNSWWALQVQIRISHNNNDKRGKKTRQQQQQLNWRHNLKPHGNTHSTMKIYRQLIDW